MNKESSTRWELYRHISFLMKVDVNGRQGPRAGNSGLGETKYRHGSLGPQKEITVLHQTRPVQTDMSRWKTYFKRMRKLHTRYTLKCFVIPAVDRTWVAKNSPEGGEFPLSVTWSTCRRLRRLGVSLTSHSNRLPGNVWRHHIGLVWILCKFCA